MEFPIDVEFLTKNLQTNGGFTAHEAALIKEYLEDLNVAYYAGVSDGMKKAKGRKDGKPRSKR